MFYVHTNSDDTHSAWIIYERNFLKGEHEEEEKVMKVSREQS